MKKLELKEVEPFMKDLDMLTLVKFESKQVVPFKLDNEYPHRVLAKTL